MLEPVGRAARRARAGDLRQRDRHPPARRRFRRWYLFRLAGGQGEGREELDAAADLAAIRAAATANSLAWEQLLAEGLDPERPIVSLTTDGETVHTYVGLRLAQAVHHGSDHRSQICTALTRHGVEPPAIDVWDYGESVGRITIDPAAVSDG